MAAWYDEGLEAQARAHERVQALLFLLRFALLIALAAVFWITGGAQALAEGLQGRLSFSYSWPLVYLLFVALAVFGYEAALFPLSVLADFSLDRAPGQSPADFGTWLRGYLITLLLEMGIVAGAFTGLHVLMRVFPSIWWVLATGAYVALVAGLGEWGPSQLLPRVRPPVAAEDGPLAEELSRAGREAGLEITGAAWWDFEHQEDLEDVRLAGRGMRRRVIYSAWAWRQLDRREKVFVAATRMAGWRYRAAWAVHGVQAVLTAGVLYGAERIATSAAQLRGLEGAAVPEAFPFLVVSLFGLAALAGVLAHGVERRLELRADRFALAHAGGVEALRTCLQREFEREPYGVTAPAWRVLLLHRKPTAARRLAQAEAWAASPSPKA